MPGSITFTMGSWITGPGPLGLVTWHMEPVRSSTSMMSSGFTEHGEQAVAVAFTVNESTPMTFANTVFTTEST